VRNAVDVVVVGRRLALLLLAVAVYFLAVGAAIQAFHVPAIEGSVGSLITTIILGLLMGLSQPPRLLSGGGKGVVTGNALISDKTGTLLSSVSRFVPGTYWSDRRSLAAYPARWRILSRFRGEVAERLKAAVC
jgi:hypothetical protein